MPDLSYPIGPYQREEKISGERRREWIQDIAGAPAKLRQAVTSLSDAQLDTPYRPEGWTVRQVVHHVPDSHMNAFVRFKLALTEDTPTIKPYDQSLWAGLPDAKGPIESSLRLLEALHERWMLLLDGMSPEDYQKSFRHPEHGRTMKLEEVLGLYSWHGRHHVAHITSLASRSGW
jgi:uncharacterized damage-inducible protein DinB